MGTVESIEEHKPHVVIRTPDRNVHVLPVALLEDFVNGVVPLSQIDDGELLMRSIVALWLGSPQVPHKEVE